MVYELLTNWGTSGAGGPGSKESEETAAGWLSRSVTRAAIFLGGSIVVGVPENGWLDMVNIWLTMVING